MPQKAERIDACFVSQQMTNDNFQDTRHPTAPLPLGSLLFTYLQKRSVEKWIWDTKKEESY